MASSSTIRFCGCGHWSKTWTCKGGAGRPQVVVVGCENYRRLKLVPEMLPLLGHRQLGAGEGVTMQAHDPGCGPRAGGPVVVRTRGKCGRFTRRSGCRPAPVRRP